MGHMSGQRVINGAKRRYERVADDLRREIEDGSIAVGDQLPTHGELVTRFRVARATIQKALKDLEGRGYVEAIQGVGVFVIDWQQHRAGESETGEDATSGSEAGEGATEGDEPDKPRANLLDSSSVELDEAIARAFEAEHITIDAYSLTAESLSAAIVPQARRILRGELRPASIQVRLLLARPGAHLAIPRIVGNPEDTRPLDRLSELIERHAFTLRNLLEDLGRRNVAVAADIRTVPITPVAKYYLLNGHQGLMGFYKVEANTVDLPDGDSAQIYDVLGLGARLYLQGPEQRAECQQWFDSLWNTIAESV